MCFGYDELREAKDLAKLTKVRNTYIKNNLIIQQTTDKDQVPKIKEKQEPLIGEFEELKKKF